MPKRAVLFSSPGVALFFGVLAASCSHKVDTGKIVTTSDIIRFLIRANPGIFSNSLLDTSHVSVAGTDFSFSRSYIIKSDPCSVIIRSPEEGNLIIDTCIVINDLDTVPNPGGGFNVVPRSPRDASADLLDDFIEELQIDSAGVRQYSKKRTLPIAKFGYFQKLQNDAYPNRGWYVMGATQTFVGTVRLIDTVHLHATNPNGLSGYPKDLLAVRQDRNKNLDPLDDPQVVKVRTSPFQLKPNDSVEVRVRVRNTLDSILYVFCHIGDLNAKRRIQLTKISSTEFLGGFKLSSEVYYDYRRLVVDAITNATLTSSSTFQNEIWGIIYQLYP